MNEALSKVRLPRPYFSGRASRRQRERGPVAGRLLLVSPHFPPSQAAGALRWQKFSRFAVERGLGVDVIALEPGSLPDPDPSRLADLPDEVRAFGVAPVDLLFDRAEDALARLWKRARHRGAPDGSGAAAAVSPPAARPRPTSFSRDEVRFAPTRPRSWLRAYWAWRDHAHGAAWARDAARLGAAIATREPPGAVITCGPPHMVHEAGRLLHGRLNVPFVLDMRDPWSLQQRLMEDVASPAWLWLARRYERRAVERASLIVCNTEPFRRAMQARYPERAERIIAVMNGFDDEPLPSAGDEERFVLSYAGTIYLDRDPRPLFRAAARVVSELRLGPERFGIELVGNVKDYGGVPMEEMARQEGLPEYVAARSFMPRGELMRFLARATMLVSLPQDSDLAIPSKVFEYMRFRAWLLAMAEPDSATGAVVREAGGDVVRPDDVDGMARVIRHRYLQFTERGRPAPLAENGGSRFSRRRQAGILLDELERLLSRSGQPEPQ